MVSENSFIDHDKLEHLRCQLREWLRGKGLTNKEVIVLLQDHIEYMFFKKGAGFVGYFDQLPQQEKKKISVCL